MGECVPTLARMTTHLTTSLTESELQELREAFELYEKGSEDGKVDKAGLRKLLRSLGHSPTDQELEEAIHQLAADGVDTLEFPEFLKLLARTVKEKESNQELREAFQ